MVSKFFIFFPLILSIQSFPQQDIKVISSDRSSIVIEFTPSYTDTLTVSINGQNYRKINFQYGYIPNASSNWGEPMIPQQIINVGVPAETGNTIQLISSSFETINGNLAPVPRPERDGKVTKQVYEIGSKYNNYRSSNNLVSFGDYGLIRCMPVQSFVISPVVYSPGQGTIKLYTKILFRINFASSQTITEKPAGEFLKDVVLNYEAAKNWSTSQGGIRKTAIYNSVLSTGKWVRFETPTEGIYKITKSMLPSLGIDPSVDPRTIKIYNNGGKVLPEDINAPRPNDLVENAILFVGSDPAKFGDNDYILFYGRGTDFWEYDSASGRIIRFHDPYSNANYYWITSGGSLGKRIQPETSLSSQTSYQQTTTKSFVYWEKDEINIGESGREYMGDIFDASNPITLSRTYTNKLNNIVSGSQLTYNISFINASLKNIELEIDENSSALVIKDLQGTVSTLNYLTGYAYQFNPVYKNNLPDDRSLLKFTISPSSQDSKGYLDYFEIAYQSQLQAVSDNLLFFSKDTTAAIQYNLGNFSTSDIRVFNVTDYANVKLITNPVINGGQCSFQENEIAGKVSKYYTVSSNYSFLTPSNLTTISNSNLHGIQQGAKYIIITNRVFNDAAQKLANYKQNQAPEKISTLVVDVDQIFNEFSCGMIDPTAIRDFIKYAYDNWQIKPEYVLFFGKGTYDPKDREGYHNDFVPAYETEESLVQIDSYATDDYYVEVSGSDDKIDLAYGRITASNIGEANTAVNKIIQYETSSEKGPWRNLITLVADDGWHSETWEGPEEHTAPSEQLSKYYIPNSFDQNKIYLAAYPDVLTSVGKRMPEVNKAIISALNKGTLIINYIGHGGYNVWADERVFVSSTTIPQLYNKDYFFLVSATCGFGYWDKPSPTSQSAAEELILKPDAGAIACFSADRLAISDNNHALDYQLFSALLENSRNSNNLPITIGKAVFDTKQIQYDDNARKYELLGDPTVRLLIPEYSATIDSINGQTLNTAPIQIKALSKERVDGEIRKPDNTLWSEYNGTGVLTMFDSQITQLLTTLDNYPMVLQGGIIFRGNISVTNGRFSTSFTVPKDISYEDKNGKVLMYFYNNNNDGLGYTTNIIVGGTDSSVVPNPVGPDIKIYFDDTTSSNAYLVNPNSDLIIKLNDPNGINATGTGIGHKLEGILNGQENNPIDFTNYFTGDLNSGGTSGVINYRFNNLTPGEYTLKVIAWDVFDNYSNKTVNFTVVGGNGLVIQDIYNYPDPFAGNTTFTFQQNLDEPLNVKIKVYTVAGRLVRQIERYGISNKFVKVNWDGRDQDGDLLANGTYLYKVIVNTVNGQYSQSALGKLAIIR